MAATLLITSEAVFDAMGQDSALMEESIPAVESAILRAMIKLKGVLFTELLRESREDTFYVSGLEGTPVAGRYTLRLNNGFVSRDDDVVITIAEEEFGTYSARPGVVVYDKGMVQIPVSSPTEILNRYIRVSYTAGFSGPKEVPEAVRQALLCYVPLLLLSTSAAVAEPKQQQALVSKATSADSIGTDMVAQYNRNAAHALRPLYSNLVE